MSFEEGRDAREEGFQPGEGSGAPARAPGGVKLLALVGGLALTLLHLTPPDSFPASLFHGARGGDEVPLFLGWIPPELLYRLVWMALAFAYLWFLAKTVWRAPGPEDEALGASVSRGEDESQ